MDLMRFTPTPYDPMEWVAKPFTERARLACQAWALQGYAAPLGIYLVYALKVAFYIGVFLGICYFTPSCHSLLDPIAFQKAILWSMLFEGLGLGCGSGPLAGRYDPPLGGVLYFARTGTTKLPLFPGVPVIGNITRSWLDVTVYLAAVVSIVVALFAPGPSIDPAVLWPIIGLVAVMGVLDKTIFLIFRSEHYWVTIICFALTPDWIVGAKWVQLALWFWAGVSKLNHHFPTVVCVMLSNSAVMRSQTVRRWLYRNYPDDLRPSRFATVAAHSGISLEFGVPLVMMFASSHNTVMLGIVLMLLLHCFITSHVPMGVPIEWNFMVVYGGFALFYAHPDISPFAITNHPLLATILGLWLVVIPLIGNFFPAAISFLLSMRYYAGNWPFSVWLFRMDAQHKIDLVKKNCETVDKQLMRFYPLEQAIAVGGRALAFRLMHLQGRVLPELLPRAVDNLDNYAYSEGELVSSVVLGWNFGEGHLHQEQLLAAVQQQCGFEEGELRCIFVESQPLFRGTLAWRIVDAKTGQREAGTMDIRDLVRRQPWATRQTISIPPDPALEPIGTAST
jgi:hypothetical protein